MTTSAPYARLAATSLGLLILALSFGIYLPVLLARPSSIDPGLNYLAIHFALAGAVLFLARGLPAPAAQPAAAPLPAAEALPARAASGPEF
jgi:hypothetical protein